MLTASKPKRIQLIEIKGGAVEMKNNTLIVLID